MPNILLVIPFLINLNKMYVEFEFVFTYDILNFGNSARSLLRFAGFLNKTKVTRVT